MLPAIPASPNDTDTLKQFRDAIDAIDDKIVTLLRERSDIVASVGEYKRAHQAHINHIRPGREALMIRRMYEAFKGGRLAPESAVALWRTIISASTAIETRFAVSVYAPENEPRFFWLAREYFGPFTPIIRQPTLNRVLGDIMEKKVIAGVLPLPHGEGSDFWWRSVPQKNTDWPKIFAYLPAVEIGKREPFISPAVALGQVTPEASGEDISYIALEVEHETSTSRLNSAFKKAALEVQFVDVDNLPNTRRVLLQIQAFTTLEDARYQNALAELGSQVLHSVFLGAHARPILAPKTP